MIGVIVIQTLETRQFEDSDIELLQTCASLLAPVVVNAQLLALMSASDEERSAVVDRIAGSEGFLERGSRIAKSPRSEKNVMLRGLATARGVAIGSIFRMDKPIDLEGLAYQPSANPEEEQRDFKAAMSEARRQIEDHDAERGAAGCCSHY